jgi:hypothetical protein
VTAPFQTGRGMAKISRRMIEQALRHRRNGAVVARSLPIR